MYNIALLGFGTVGQGVYEVITKNAGLIESKTGEKINIKYILDLRDFPDHPASESVVHDFKTILEDPDIKLVVEMMGGSHPAFDFSLAALKAGKHVVTSNKEVVANFGTKLLANAAENGVSYLFEASVGGGIPIIRPMINDLAQNNVNEINGILNGTTNYILTQMSQFGADFSETLKDAQAKGYAEANPTADVEGIDAARKIVILAALAYGVMLPVSDVHTEGITKLTDKDIKAAKDNGYAVKLIAHAEKRDGKILAMVTPRLVPDTDPLYGVCDVFNGIKIDTDMLGVAMFYGRGAGKLPTASAVVADVIDAVINGAGAARPRRIADATSDDVANFDNYSCKVMYLFADGSTEITEEKESEAFKGKFAVAKSRIRLI